MIPAKDKKYMLNRGGLYDYNRYAGEGICTGQTATTYEETIYGFKLPRVAEICYFLDKEIIAELGDDNQVRPLICDPKNYPEDSESPYCETCNSCEETGCCPPINCKAVVCKYGEINLKEYQCFQDQWEVMHNALKDIIEEYSDELHGRIAKNALNEVDKLWDKLYNKEQA